MPSKHPPMVMRESDVNKRMQLLREWDWLCVLCGQPFASIASVTIEHLMPKSRVKNVHDNRGPSHYNCNNFRETMSLLEATYCLARKRRVMGYPAFTKWINKQVPHRIIPSKFLAIHTMPHEPQLPGYEFIRLPEHLPGM